MTSIRAITKNFQQIADIISFQHTLYHIPRWAWHEIFRFPPLRNIEYPFDRICSIIREDKHAFDNIQVHILDVQMRIKAFIPHKIAPCIFHGLNELLQFLQIFCTIMVRSSIYLTSKLTVMRNCRTNSMPNVRLAI